MEAWCFLPQVGQQPKVLYMFLMSVKLSGVKVLNRFYFEQRIYNSFLDVFNYVELKAENSITHKFLDRLTRTTDNAPK